MKVTNNSTAIQGLHTILGVRYVRPGESKELRLTERQAERVRRISSVELDGDPESDPDPVVGSLETAVSGEGVYIPASEFNAIRQQFEALQAEKQRLQDLLDAKHEGGPKGPFEVKETSAGWFAAFDASGQQVGSKMRQADADAFKAMSQEEQEQLLAK